MSAASLDPSAVAPKLTARDRLLAAADELFYAEGVHIVGIDRIIERAGVAKASLYSAFGSKDELVRAYLEGREERRRTRILSKLEHYEGARAKLLGIFEVQAQTAASPQFRGCAFYNASAESAGEGPAQEVADSSRAWTRGLMIDLAREAGVPDPETMTTQLLLLYDGANVGARMDHDPKTCLAARTVAAALLDAALAYDKP